VITLLQVSAQRDNEIILKIGQHLTKLCVQYWGLTFWPTLYMLKEFIK